MKPIKYSFFVLLLLLTLSGCNRSHKNDHSHITFHNKTHAQIALRYKPVMRLIPTLDTARSQKEFRHHIMLYNDEYNKKNNHILNTYRDLPYVQYKSILNKDTKRLKRIIRLSNRKKKKISPVEKEHIISLIKQLESLNKAIVVAEEYRQEKLRLADRGIGPLSILKFGIGSVASKLIFV